MPTPTVHRRACNLCEAICGLIIEVQDGAVSSLKGDPDDPLSRGYICPKAFALADIHADPERLRSPIRRVGDRWEPVGWDEAIDEAAARLGAVQAEHGRDAVGVYQGNPSVHNAGTMLFSPPFVRTLKTRNRFSATSVDQLPHHLMAWAMFGHQMLIPVPDIDRTDFLLMLGANPLASNGSLLTAPGMGDRLKALAARGGRCVLIDPRRTETARHAEHHFIRPGTDALLLLALVRTLLAEGLAAPGRLTPMLDRDLTELAALANPFTPAAVAPATGIDAASITQLARDFAAADAAACYGRMGVSTQEFGGLCNWLITVLNILTGNLDRVGGAMFAAPAFDTLPLGGKGHSGRYTSRVRGLPEFGGELPAAALAEEIDTPGDGRIRALVTSAGNPVLSTPNGPRLDEALAGLDFMVSIDIYLNETTRHADLILPPTTGLETDNYDLAFHALAVRNTARYSRATVPPGPDTRHDWQIFRALRSRLLLHAPDPSDRGAMTDGMDPAQLIDFGLQSGPYGADTEHALSLAALDAAPSGIDLGPLRPCLPDRLFTGDKRICLVPDGVPGEIARVQERLAAPVSGLLLIGRRSLRDNNSWMHNSPRLNKGEDRCTLLIHPDDAARCGVASGDRVVVRSRVGAVEAPVVCSDAVMPGVVSLPHGFGHGRPGTRQSHAAARPGVSVNDLTDEGLLDGLSGNAAVNGVPVTVHALA